MTICSKNTILSVLTLLTSLLSLNHCAAPITGLSCTLKTSTVVESELDKEVEKVVKGKFDEKLDENLERQLKEKPVKKRTNTTTSVTMIHRCVAGYPRKDMIRKCENFIDSQNPLGPELFTPITNTSNVTFSNRYCAVCNRNFEWSWSEWRSYVQHDRDHDNPCEKYESKIRQGDVDSITKFTQIFIDRGMKLVSRFLDRKELVCEMEEKWPINLLNRVIPCLVRNFRIGQNDRLKKCQYGQKSGRICTKMRLFIEGIVFPFGDKNYTIYEKWTELNFTRDEYVVKSGYDNVFYLCEQPRIIYPVGHWGKISITVVSIIFICGYLVMKCDKKYFRNFTGKVIYSYLAGLIIIYLALTFVYLSYPIHCVIFYLAEFSWFYHLFWTKVITAEFFHVIYFAYRKRILDTKSQHKRFVIFCIVAIVLPTTLISIYYFVLQNNDNHCPSVPGHLSLECNFKKDSFGESFLNIVNLIMKKNFTFFMPFLFVLAHVCVVMYFTKWGSNGLKSKTNRYHLISLMKMSYLMAFHWLLHRICVTYGRDVSFSVFGLTTNMDMVSQLCVDLQGVFAFFVFGFESDKVIGVLKRCGCKFEKKSRKSDSTEVKARVKFQKSNDGEQGNSIEIM